MKIKKQKDDFVEYVVEQLACFPNVFAKHMFGGHGLYQGEHFIGVLSDGRLYFKTDDETKQQYIDHGMSYFQPSEKIVLKHYYEVPVSILEDEDAIEEWAQLAIDVAIRQEASKPKKRFKQGRKVNKDEKVTES